MERILVSMKAFNGAWEAWSRAISLARRIDAKIYALLVTPRETKGMKGPVLQNTTSIVRDRLELLMEAAKLDGIHIDFFISEGSYDEEVVRFVELNRITLVVVEHSEMDTNHNNREWASVQKILHRINCRVEVVSSRARAS